MSLIPDDEPLRTHEDESLSMETQHAGQLEIAGADPALETPVEILVPGVLPVEALPGEQVEEERPLFQAVLLPEPPRIVRIPHFGHFLLLLAIVGVAFICAGVLIWVALHFHLYGVSTLQGTTTEIHYTLGSEGLGYLFTLFGCVLIFPILWHKSFFTGVHWNGATAARLRWKLVSAAFVCFLLALVNSLVLPGPSNTPIEKAFRQPGAAWLLFVFGVTFAPFFEELFFRGFLLPALSTAYDWTAEKLLHVPMKPLDENDNPQWSLAAMIVASICTSIPFALLHAAQTGNSVGPLLLLVSVSMVLCGVRLWTRSLAASTLVHSSYNFMLFAMMLIASHGFKHMDKM
jgi:membrane protease YdiL (CAAX protease family)